jgi:hypothetical protein
LPIHYRPILAGRLGEFEAMAQLNDVTWQSTTPLIDLVPQDDRASDQLTTEDTASKGPARYFIRRFRDLVVKHYRADMHFAIDASGIPPDYSLAHGGGVLREALAESSIGGIEAVPVVRLGDPAAWPDVAAAPQRQGLVVRLLVADLEQDMADVTERIQQLLQVARTPSSHADLLVDLGRTPRSSWLSSLAGRMQPIIGSRFWRSVTIASGSFPQDLRDVAPWSLSEIPRRDAASWLRLREVLRLSDVDYGDYAVAHPIRRRAGASPPPQLRYTLTDRWLVLKGERNKNQQFFEICRQVHDHPEFTSHLGRADDLIARRSRGPASGLSAGNGATWRGLSTAHHLDFVAEQLRRPDEPPST